MWLEDIVLIGAIGIDGQGGARSTFSGLSLQNEVWFVNVCGGRHVGCKRAGQNLFLSDYCS